MKASDFLDATDQPSAEQFLGEETPPSYLPETGAGKLVAGIGGGMVNLAEGAKERTLELGEWLGMVNPKTLADYKKYLEEVRQIDKPLYETTPGMIGKVVGETALTAPIPGGVAGGLARRAATAGLAGAAVGGLQPVGEKESLGWNIATGAAGGAAGAGAAGAVTKVGQAIFNPTKNAIQTLSEKYGIRTTLGEVKGSKGWQKVETWLEDVPIIGLKGFRERQRDEAEAAAKNFLGKYIYDPGAVDVFKMNKDFSSALFEDLKRMIPPGNLMPMNETRRSASQLLTRYPDMFNILQDRKMKSVLTEVSAAERPMSWDEMWTLREGIGDALGKARQKLNRRTGEIDSNQVDQLSNLYASINRDIEGWSGMINVPEIKAGLDVANEAYKNYVIKFSMIEDAFAKASGKYGGKEGFSPKDFSTSLKDLVRKQEVGNIRLFKPGEIEEMAGLANIMQAAKRGGQFMENPPTGYRYGPVAMGAGFAGGVSAAPVAIPSTAILSFLTGTEAGKRLALSASKMEPDSLALQSLMKFVYRGASRVPAVAAVEEFGE